MTHAFSTYFTLYGIQIQFPSEDSECPIGALTLVATSAMLHFTFLTL